jgi:SAM-dependent methyltransferase
MNALSCRICGHSENNMQFQVKEMMHGTRELYEYFQCSRCQCLQISSIPEDMSKFYPTEYYSYQAPPEKTACKRWLFKQRDRFAVHNRGCIGRLMYHFFPHLPLRSLVHMPLQHNWRILDVGCGQGLLLQRLAALGYQNLAGIDPFNAADMRHNGVSIWKKSIHEMDGEFDCIMFHHSFEHVPDPLSTLQLARQLLAKNGYLLVRIPIVSSAAWREYGVHWVQLDAPRHFYLHSLTSMELLAQKTNLVLQAVHYDSAAMQFWGSEQYRQDIGLWESRSYCVNPQASLFSKADIKRFQRQAKELNAKGQGDQAIFILS